MLLHRKLSGTVFSRGESILIKIILSFSIQSTIKLQFTTIFNLPSIPSTINFHLVPILVLSYIIKKRPSLPFRTISHNKKPQKEFPNLPCLKLIKYQQLLSETYNPFKQFLQFSFKHTFSSGKN